MGTIHGQKYVDIQSQDYGTWLQGLVRSDTDVGLTVSPPIHKGLKVLGGIEVRALCHEAGSTLVSKISLNAVESRWSPYFRQYSVSFVQTQIYVHIGNNILTLLSSTLEEPFSKIFLYLEDQYYM